MGLFLHNIGLCKIPPEIKNRPNLLNHNEWRMIRQHPAEGYKILNTMNSITDEIKIIIMQHHERKSGRGYPKGLKGDQVHQYGEICSLVDAFDALTSRRPYRKTVENTFNALLILKNEMSRDITPKVFTSFVSLFHGNGRTDTRLLK